MPEFKEKPKMDKPKSRPASALSPKQVGRLMRDKYLQQLDQRPEGMDNEAITAVDQVEDAERWAVQEVYNHRPRSPREHRNVPKEKIPSQEKTQSNAPNSQPIQKKERGNTVHTSGEPERMEHRESTITTKQNRNTPKERKPYTIREHSSSTQVTKENTNTVSPHSRQAVPLDQRRKLYQKNHFQVTHDVVDHLPIPEDATSLVNNIPTGRRYTPQHHCTPKEHKGYSPKRHKAAAFIKNTPRPIKTKSKGVKTAGRTAKELPKQRMIHAAAQNSKKAAKTAASAVKRVAQAVVKAVSAVVGAVAGFVGGSVVLIALVIIIMIAAVANSPFGIFFTEERNAPDTVSVSEAIAQVNMAYNAKLEELQNGDYDSVTIKGSAPDWADVLAVFAVKTSATDGGLDVATLDTDRVERLTAVFWDMTTITTEVETIHHPGSKDESGWTERILHITITGKTADEMRTVYNFTAYQNSALDELLSDRAALSSLAGSLVINNADAQAILQALPTDLSPERRAVVKTALSLSGRVNYFWGGKSLVLGWDSRWGELRQVTAAGSPTTGTYRPFGLDCSGYADWVFYNASGGSYVIGHGGGARAQHTYCTPITWDEAQPGDLVFYPDDVHVGIVCGRDSTGNIQIIHCASSANNVVITGKVGFVSVGRPHYYT